MSTILTFSRVTACGAVAMGVLLLSGCGGVKSYGFSPEVRQAQTGDPLVSKPGRNEFFPPASGTKIDMLFVVDNSGSMAEEHDILASSFANFISQFKDKGIDFHIGVITTDTSREGDAAYWSSKLVGYVNPNMGCLLTKTSGERYLSNASSNLEAKFSSIVKVGTAGSGSEQGLNSMSLAMEPARIGAGGCNAGFLRNDSMFWAGVFSDENEDIKNGETPQSRVDRVMAMLNALRGPSTRGWRMDFVVDTSAPKPSSPITYPLSSSATNSYPEVYRLAAGAMSAPPINIAQDFSAKIVAAGGEIIKQASEFKLSQVPIPGTLQVFLNDRELREGVEYRYVDSRNTIELLGSTSAAGGKLVVEYDYL